MALHITNPDVEHAVRALAQERGQSITEVVGAAVKDFSSKPMARTPRPTVESLVALLESFPQAPVDYSLSEDEILGYGPEGYCEP
jgi:hypothetical protein